MTQIINNSNGWWSSWSNATITITQWWNTVGSFTLNQKNDETIALESVILRATNNILHYNNENELYADLQIENWMTPTSAFPIWIAVGNVDSTDWWTQSGVLLNAKTESWTYMRWLYGDDSKLYFDGGLWTFKVIATTDDITSALSALRNELATVAFTWKSSDLDNDADFNSVPVMTMEQYNQETGAAWNNKRYLIYEIVD